MFTRVNQKTIKSSRNKYVMRKCFKCWRMKNIFRTINHWFWLVYKFTENNCRLRHFSEFIKIQKMYSTSVDKIIILTWKLLVTSSQIFSCVNQTPKELTTSKICHVSRCGFKVLILNISFKTKNSKSTERRKISFPKEIVKPVLSNTKQ